MGTTFSIRHPEEGDIEGIRAVVKSCEPLIMTYIPYYYWIATRYFFDTCAVAEKDGKIVGWCCILAVPNEKYFVHQLGVAPEARGHKMAESLVSWLFARIKAKGGTEIELTIERGNHHVKKLFARAAEETGLKLIELSDYSKILDKEYNETLYVIKEAA
jgi:L-2,4-diaminobutyric acid acetyltransferase